MMNVTAYGHLDAAGESLEDTFYLVVLIGSLGLDMEVHTGRITQRLEEMEEHLRRHISHFLTVELSVPNQPRTATEIQRHTTQAIVHRKGLT